MTDVARTAVEVPADIRAIAAQALADAAVKVDRLVTHHPDFLPLFTKDGQWKHELEAWTNWCEGFPAGMMWIFARHLDSSVWRPRAEHYSELVRGREHDRDVHDLGFTFWHSWRPWLRSTGDEALNGVIIQAGTTMGLRFHEQAGFLRSFLAPDSTFIDIMMNVGIVFYAAQQSGDADLLRRANTHCLQTRRYLVRGDGSASHEGVFDLRTGEFLRQTTQQGFRDDSSWARGQSWALYGFGTAYAFTGDERFLQTARACADFYIDRTGEAFVPPNDWEEPNPAQPFESSAGAIAASGLLQLAALVPDRAESARYAAYAFEIVRTLSGPRFSASSDPAWDGILKHGSYHETKNLGVNESVMWGEYFYVETLDKVLGGELVATSR
ncbi:glycosyl hydrolase [Cellulomonas sp.]|uniref:glycosyl hydrolase n=1 Tax=Cellulomonas sp. TaxID=40001 RepID=UPI003BAB8F3C